MMMRIDQLLEAAVMHVPSRRAITDETGTWSYRELWDNTVAAAASLTRLGCNPGDRVVLATGERKDTFALTFAASMVGAIVVPISDPILRSRFVHVVKDSEPVVVVVADGGFVDVRGTRASIVEANQLFGEPLRGDCCQACFEGGLMFYTSGSTALPKGVWASHAQVLFAVEAIQARLRYSQDDTVLNLLPLSFDYGLYQGLLSAKAGAHLVLHSRERAGIGLAGLFDADPSVLPVVPTLAQSFSLAARRIQPRSVRLITNTGAQLSPERCAQLRNTFPNAGIVPMYGLTECKRVSIGQPDEDLARPGSVGPPLPGTTVHVVDDSGQNLSPGEVGEFIVKGPHVTNGYWRDERLTQRRFGRDRSGARFLRTGDYGFVDLSGNLYFQGRRDELMKIRGLRTSSAEIEAAIEAIEQVEGVCVIPSQDRTSAHAVVAAQCSVEELVRRLARWLEADKFPVKWTMVESLPMLTSGKLDRSTVHALWGDHGG